MLNLKARDVISDLRKHASIRLSVAKPLSVQFRVPIVRSYKEMYILVTRLGEYRPNLALPFSVSLFSKI